MASSFYVYIPCYFAHTQNFFPCRILFSFYRFQHHHHNHHLYNCFNHTPLFIPNIKTHVFPTFSSPFQPRSVVLPLLFVFVWCLKIENSKRIIIIITIYITYHTLAQQTYIHLYTEEEDIQYGDYYKHDMVYYSFSQGNVLKRKYFFHFHSFKHILRISRWCMYLCMIIWQLLGQCIQFFLVMGKNHVMPKPIQSRPWETWLSFPSHAILLFIDTWTACNKEKKLCQ